MAGATPLLSAPASRPGIRRVSSVVATHEDLVSGPTVVVPPKHLMVPSNAHETAASIELAKRHMSDISTGLETPTTPPATTVTDQFAFCFDIGELRARTRGKLVITDSPHQTAC